MHEGTHKGLGSPMQDMHQPHVAIQDGHFTTCTSHMPACCGTQCIKADTADKHKCSSCRTPSNSTCSRDVANSS